MSVLALDYKKDAVAALSDDLKALSLSNARFEELKKQAVDIVNKDDKVRNIFAELMPVALPKAASVIEGLDGGFGIAQLAVTSQALVAAYDFSGLKYNYDETPANLFDKQIDDLLAEYADYRRAELPENRPSRQRGAGGSGGTSGKLTTAYGITAGARVPPSDSPVDLWSQVHDLSLEKAAYALRDYDQAYNADDSLDWLVEACALYLMMRTSTSPTGTISTDIIGILNAATGVDNRVWSYPQKNVYQVAASLNSADTIVFPTEGVPEEIRWFGPLQQIFRDLAAEKDVLLNLARLKWIAQRILPFMVDITQAMWKQQYERFITPMLQQQTPQFIEWITRSSATTLSDPTWLGNKLTKGSAPAGYVALCICVYLDSKYGGKDVPRNKREAIRGSFQKMKLPLVRSYYFMNS